MSWFEGAGRARLEQDQKIVAEFQPALRFLPQRDGSMALVGDVTFKLQSGSPQRIATRIHFPPDYPLREPRAIETADRFQHDADHHFYPNGQVCLWLDVETRWRSTDPAALGRFLDELTVFYYRQLMMEADPTLPYPGPWRAHGPAGYVEHLEERLCLAPKELPRVLGAIEGGVYRNAPCPCGSRTRYRNCHRRAIHRFRDRIAPQALDQVLDLLRRMRDRRTNRPRQ